MAPKRAAAGESTSGVLLRLPARLHAVLRAAAAAAGLSLNEYCIRRLAAPGTATSMDADAAAAVARAGQLFGSDLVAVLVYGSWAQGQAAAGSDVDLLVVVDRTVAITRALYRQWDSGAIAWHGRPVDPHFVHVPRPRDAPTGLWGEVAIAGVVLFERDDRVASHLARVRRDIADGRLVRRIVHGQPYWTMAA